MASPINISTSITNAIKGLYKSIENANKITIDNCIPSVGTAQPVDGAVPVKLEKEAKAPKQQVLKSTRTMSYRLKNNNEYPKSSDNRNKDGDFDYNYTINIQKEMKDAIQQIKENLNIPSAYSRLELNKLFHKKFNRFRIQYPDYFLNNTVAYVVMTRPDLNIMASDGSGNFHSQVLNDPQLYYIAQADPVTARSLTKAYTSSHHFNPILSNTLTSLDISDESIDTLETGETFSGFRTQYAKSNIRSMVAGTISLKFPETYNMAVTHAHQLWCTYESCVYRGTMKPKDEYIWKKELDYACDIYYFLLDTQDMIIRYWCKYTGCFPLNVNKSVFSYDAGSQITHPELSVTYAYFTREDMSAININEFNNNSGGNIKNFKYRANYVPSLNASGNTWANAPFIEPITVKSGMGETQLFALRFRD